MQNPPHRMNLCRYDWTKCADNEQLVNQYYDWSHVQVECKHTANDRARYGNPDWPWAAFGSFYKRNNYITSGIAVAVEPDAQFSNGFGAMVHSRVTCTCDLRAKRVRRGGFGTVVCLGCGGPGSDFIYPRLRYRPPRGGS